MAKCFITGKTTTFEKSHSHAHNVSNRKVKANLQRVHIEENGTRKHVFISARALKSANLHRVLSIEEI